MKWLRLLSILPAASLAFQQAVVAPIRVQRAKTIMNYFPDKFARAEQCATHLGTCDLEELEELADELEQFQKNDNMQGHDDYQDTKRVTEILRAQSELKHKVDDYVNDHHEETFDMSDV